ncbi:MAG: hypothetical protein KJO54_13265 [Gammaproteobacteria bacterium]|nr:hypothetical protein [Gammaproteobacteria bacterium]NNF60626.1 hypothetical protein [Gammaproteobacteria bacterium]
MRLATDRTAIRRLIGHGSLTLVLLSLLVACVPGQFIGKKARCNFPGIQSVDVSSDDGMLLFSYCDEDNTYVATSGIDGDDVKVIRRADDNAIFQRVVFSPDNQQIYFIRRSSRDKSYLYAMDVDGSNVQSVTSGGPGTNNVLDFVIAADGQRIYYSSAGIFRSYSPVAAARPHDVDFYSMKLNGTDIRKITQMHAYAINGVAVSRDESELYYYGGVVDIASGAYQGPLPFTLSPEAGITGEIAAWTSPHPMSEVSGDGLLLVACGKRDKPGQQRWEEVAGYGLYVNDTKSRLLTREIVWLHAYLDSPTWRHRGDGVLFIRNDLLSGARNYSQLWYVQTDGSDLERILLDLP